MHVVQRRDTALEEETSELGSLIHKQYPPSVASYMYTAMNIFANVSSFISIVKNMTGAGKTLPESVPIMISLPRKCIAKTLNDVLSACPRVDGKYVSREWASKEGTWVKANLQLSALREGHGWEKICGEWIMCHI
eukprot:2592387-Pyramimonas_sp.AAC.1